MVREVSLVPVLDAASSLEVAGKGLIAAAIAAGGRDNITVILFRLEDVDTSGVVGSTETQVTAEGAAVETGEDEYEDFRGAAVTEPRQGITRSEQATLAGEGAMAEGAGEVRATDQDEQAYKEEFATTALPALPRTPAPQPDPTPAPAPAPSASPPGATRATTDRERPTKRRRFPLKGLLIFLVVAAIVVSAAWVAIRAVFFVGVDDRQTVTIYRGLPYDLPLGIDLYSTHYTSGKTLAEIPPTRRKAFTEEKLRSLSDAEELVKDAEDGKIKP
jgi:protein phosphatase